jgi:hypothetical protein
MRMLACLLSGQKYSVIAKLGVALIAKAAELVFLCAVIFEEFVLLVH